ncbi:MAG: sigma-70 family RNA polymerase sigma factor [Chloroflexaceae bacterium]|nr:sigma-70 family RNA polymerase sigma factor [Chloroflexaceae bacterium]
MSESAAQNDLFLVQACQRGDADAWESLVRRYQRLVYAIPRRAGLNDDQCADVFQRTFATLVEKIGGLEQPERVGAWLVTTARRESWRVSRRERSTVSLPGTNTDDGEEQEAELADTSALPDELVLRLEQQHQVRTALQQLDERCRTLLTMLFYRTDAPPYAEIAARLGTSEGSIGPTRARCLQKLRTVLEQQGW